MKRNLKVIFLCDFDLSRGSGKDRATRQKLKALKEKVEVLDVVSSSFRNPLARFLSILFLDLKAALKLLKLRPHWLISRGHTGLLSQFIAKKLGVLTIREVHSNAIEEVDLIDCSRARYLALRVLALLSNKIDLSADIRIFNHPDLLGWYKNKDLAGDRDFFVYNGFDPDAKSEMSKSEARKSFKIDHDAKIIVFVGAATKWHGVEYLVELQEELNKNGDGIQIFVGGGDMSKYDPEGRCVNLSPLDQDDCANLIRAADFCALPVKSNRISPGSPLKLYDYIANERFVLAQSNINGYSDEILKYGIGCPVDFTSPASARSEVLKAFKAQRPSDYPECPVTWSDRIEEWLSGIDLTGN